MSIQKKYTIKEIEVLAEEVVNQLLKKTEEIKNSSEYQEFTKYYTDEITEKVSPLLDQLEEARKQVEELEEKQRQISEEIKSLLGYTGRIYGKVDRTDLERYIRTVRDNKYKHLLDIDRREKLIEVKTKLILNNPLPNPIETLINEYTHANSHE